MNTPIQDRGETEQGPVHRKTASEAWSQPALFYPPEVKALLNSLLHVKSLIQRYPPQEGKWLAWASRELNRWIRRLKLVLRVRI